MFAELNWMLIGITTLGAWIGGALWFGPIFGKVWMKIHHGDTLPTQEEMKEHEKGMWKLLVAEFCTSFAIITALATLISLLQNVPALQVSLFVWLGFILPKTISDTIWGKDTRSMMPLKIAINASYSFILLLTVGYIFSIWG
jgi:hypothetical protein